MIDMDDIESLEKHYEYDYKGYRNSCYVYIADLRELLEAQPEIIRCKDCKHHYFDAGYGYDWCNRTNGLLRIKPDDFCSRAERRTDG